MNANNLTKRDVELLEWVNGFGFVTSDQMAVQMGVCNRVANRRLQKLEDMGAIRRERVFMRESAIITVTGEGVKMVGDPINPLKKLKLGSFEHDKQLVDLSLKLTGENQESQFVPERRIRREIGLKGVGQSGHIPDGHLVLGDDSIVAIELELTRKQNFRLKKIIRELQSNLAIKGVWYFCPSNVAAQIADATKGDPFFEIYEIEGGE